MIAKPLAAVYEKLGRTNEIEDLERQYGQIYLMSDKGNYATSAGKASELGAKPMTSKEDNSLAEEEDEWATMDEKVLTSDEGTVDAR